MPETSEPTPVQLFRSQALEHRRPSIEGSILIRIAPGWSAIGWLVTLLVVAVFGYLLMSEFSRKESVNGILVSHPDLVRVRCVKPGTVSKVLVANGAPVRAGEALFEIETDPADNGGRAIAATRLAELDAEAQEMTNQEAVERAIADRRAIEITTQISILELQARSLEESLGLQQQTNELRETQVDAIEALVSKGYATKVELRNRQAEYQSELIALQSLRTDLTAKRAEIVAKQAELEQLPRETALKISQIESALAQIKQRKAEMQGRTSYEVLAPVDGRIDLLQIQQGQNVQAGMIALALLPTGATLSAELFVPSRAVAFLEEGQDVRIAYDAFPYVQFGFAQGKIDRISYTVLDPNELTQPVATGEPVYKVSVSLAAATMEFDGQELALRPGMALTGDIILKRQSLIAWLLGSAKQAWDRL